MSEGIEGQRPMDPATALTVTEAASLAGVGSREIEALMADGTLLFETERQQDREVPMVRLMDLADAYPAVLPQRAPREEREKAPKPSDPVQETPLPQLLAVDDTAPKGPEPGAMADAVRASSADREALIHLCQDLETRLDLAERERQASTASLLMAQRRVLDLELQKNRRPMAMAAAATLGLFGLTLAFLAFRLPKTVSAAARTEVQGLEERLAQRAATSAADLQASLAAAQANGERRHGESTARYEAQIAALEDRLTESRRLHVAEVARIADQVRNEAKAERDGAAEARAVQRSAEAEQRRLELAAWEERIQGAELATSAAREALKLERVLNGADRAAFRSELDEALGRHNDALDAALDRLQKSQAPQSVLPFGPIGTKEAPAPWWKRALIDLRD